MTPDYEVYKSYDPKATMEIDVYQYFFKVFYRLDTMLEALKLQKPAISDKFVDRLSHRLDPFNATSPSKAAPDIVNREEITEHFPHLQENLALRDKTFEFLLKHLGSPDTYSKETGKAVVSYLNYSRADNLLQYNAIKALVDVLGREPAIQVYKETVEYLGKEQAIHRPVTITFQQFRESFIKSSSTDGGFSFAIAHFDESKFLAKFDRCVIYESLKDVDDPELGYYATCYLGMTVGRHRLENIRGRRTQTLFTGSFCDELYWDPGVHDEPKQPPLKYSRSLIIK
jgi:hypothetical protein